jgi:hypothetical protein
MKSQWIPLLALFSLGPGVYMQDTLAQEHTILLAPCCENQQAEEQQADQPSNVDNYPSNCANEIQITCRQCVDRTRDHLLCSGTGSRHCREIAESTYPRYYALYFPVGSSNTSLSFTGVVGGQNPLAKVIKLVNNVWRIWQEFDEDLPWVASSDRSWLSISPSSSTLWGRIHSLSR